MKAEIVTFIRAYNYGAVLQCYALCKKLQSLGDKVEVVDYYPDYFRKCYDVEGRVKPSAIPSYSIRGWLRNWWTHITVRSRNAAFDRFLSKYVPLTNKKYSTFEEIASEQFLCDCFISGSDQVFSYKCVPFDPVYFLQFPQAMQKPRFAYAASFGVANIPNELRAEYVRRLTGWDRIAVREETASRIVEDLIGETPELACDPTLLLTKQDWEKIAVKKERKRPFIALYSVNGADVLVEFTKELQAKQDLEVIALTSCMTVARVMGYQERYHGFKMQGAASPEEWLGYIISAEYIVTDSFHGVVFSILNRKKFAVLTKIGNHINNRVIELIQTLGIPGTVTEKGFFCIDNDVEWQSIETKLEEVRIHSIDYLQSLSKYGEN